MQTGNTDSNNWYEVLGLTASASQEEIRIAYRQKALIYHPDKTKAYDKVEWQKLLQAYEILNDISKRRNYDFQCIKEKILSCLNLAEVENVLKPYQDRLIKEKDEILYNSINLIKLFLSNFSEENEINGRRVFRLKSDLFAIYHKREKKITSYIGKLPVWSTNDYHLPMPKDLFELSFDFLKKFNPILILSEGCFSWYGQNKEVVKDNLNNMFSLINQKGIPYIIETNNQKNHRLNFSELACFMESNNFFGLYLRLHKLIQEKLGNIPANIQYLKIIMDFSTVNPSQVNSKRKKVVKYVNSNFISGTNLKEFYLNEDKVSIKEAVQVENPAFSNGNASRNMPQAAPAFNFSHANNSSVPNNSIIEIEQLKTEVGRLTAQLEEKNRLLEEKDRLLEEKDRVIEHLKRNAIIRQPQASSISTTNTAVPIFSQLKTENDMNNANSETARREKRPRNEGP